MTSETRAAVLAGGAVGGVTCALYMLGAGRNYDYDSSQTVGTFIATPSPLDAFRRQTVFNNHPLFSFLDHLVYSAGGHSAAVLRVLPVLFGALAVALVTAWVVRRWGIVAGVSAGFLLAANPAFSFYSRAVRGYSLVTLSAVASTQLLVRLLRRDGGVAGAGYVAAAAAGIATHLYALFPFLAQIVAVSARGAFNGRWFTRFAAALALGALAYVRIGVGMVEAARRQTHHFRPAFPLALARTVLGGTSLAIAVVAALLVLGFAVVLRREVVAAAVALAAAIGAVWLWLQPLDLYPRFLVWLVAAVAALVGAALGRWRWAAGLGAAAVIAIVVVDVPHWTQNPIPDRQAAQLVDTARAHGDRACVLPWIRGSLLAYTRAPHEVTRPQALARCDVVVGILTDSRGLRRAARDTLPYTWTLTAKTPFLVYSRLPRSQLVHGRA